MLNRPAPAKINLGLHILRRRADGFHDIETVFLQIPWSDTLSIQTVETPGLTLTCSDPSLPTDETNLVMKAARLLAERFPFPEGVALHLEKHLPHGAGLGGGSSDAATTLRLLAQHFQLPVPEETLHELALQLGSDVPFFLGAPAAYATGRGENLSPLLDATGSVYRLPFTLVVVVPPVFVSTAEAYRMIHPSDAHRPDLPALILSNDLDRWRAFLKNDFEIPISTRYPRIGQARQMLVEAGARYAALSGSGAAVFGVFEDKEKAAAAAEIAQEAGHRVWLDDKSGLC